MTASMSDDRRRHMTVAQVAVYWSISKDKVYEEIKSGRLPAYQVGSTKTLRIRREDMVHLGSGIEPSCEPRATKPTASRPLCGVYFVQSGRFIKIGISTDIRNRLRGLLTGSPHDFQLLAYYPAPNIKTAKAREAELHRLFEANHHRLEWFHFAEPLATYVHALSLKTPKVVVSA